MKKEPESPKTNILTMARPVVTQDDLIELRAYKAGYESKKREILEALQAGAKIEPGFHTARIRPKLIIL